MKVDIISLEFLFKMLLFVMKTSGFAFYSVKWSDNGAVQIYNSFSDYLIFGLSFLLSAAVIYISGGTTREVGIKSVILSDGTILLWQLSLIASMITKVLNFFSDQKSFSIFLDLRWFERKVRQISKSSLFCFKL